MTVNHIILKCTKRSTNADNKFYFDQSDLIISIRFLNLDSIRTTMLTMNLMIPMLRAVTAAVPTCEVLTEYTDLLTC